MEQSKNMFIVDNYLEVHGPTDLLGIITQLYDEGILFVVEPRPADWYRIHVRKEMKNRLEECEEILTG